MSRLRILLLAVPIVGLELWFGAKVLDIHRQVADDCRWNIARQRTAADTLRYAREYPWRATHVFDRREP